jgi:hypothetical protein
METIIYLGVMAAILIGIAVIFVQCYLKVEDEYTTETKLTPSTEYKEYTVDTTTGTVYRHKKRPGW